MTLQKLIVLLELYELMAHVRILLACLRVGRHLLNDYSESLQIF